MQAPRSDRSKPGDGVRAEPFDAVPLAVGVIFGDDDEEERDR